MTIGEKYVFRLTKVVENKGEQLLKQDETINMRIIQQTNRRFVHENVECVCVYIDIFS